MDRSVHSLQTRAGLIDHQASKRIGHGTNLAPFCRADLEGGQIPSHSGTWHATVFHTNMPATLFMAKDREGGFNSSSIQLEGQIWPLQKHTSEKSQVYLIDICRSRPSCHIAREGKRGKGAEGQGCPPETKYGLGAYRRSGSLFPEKRGPYLKLNSRLVTVSSRERRNYKWPTNIV